MKKFLFGLATLVLFASCSQNETIEVSKGNAIDFQNAFVGNATRSVVDPSYNMTTGNLRDFAVYGFMNQASGVVFTDELVSKQNDGSWAYQNTQYWTPNKTYYFAALAPGDASTRKWTLTQASGDAAKLGIGTVDFENHGTQDLLYWANVYVNDANNNQAETPVAITFNHLLSKVKFTFTNDLMNDNASIRVNDITITNAHTNATIDLATNNWWTNLNAWVINENITEQFLFGNATGDLNNEKESIKQGESQESFNELLLFPQKDEQLSITFSIDLLYGDQVADTYAHDLTITQTLQMGYSYNFKATINKSNIIDPDDPNHPDADMKEIIFTVDAIKDWVKPNDVTIPAGQDTPAQP